MATLKNLLNIMIKLNICIYANHAMYQVLHYSFCHELLSLRFGGPTIKILWERFTCNHRYGYARDVIPRRIGQTELLTSQ